MLYDVVDITEMSGRSDYKRINFKDLQVMISNAEYLLDRLVVPDGMGRVFLFLLFTGYRYPL